MWEIAALRMLLITLLGILLFLFLLKMMGRIEGRYIKIRKHKVTGNSNHTKVIISMIYIILLVVTVLFCFYIIDWRIGGTM